MPDRPAAERKRVVIAGGGFAAVEALLALRERAGPDLDLVLVSPRPTLDFRPAATAEAFADGEPHRYPLEAIAADMGATYRRDALDSVVARAHRVELRSFRQLGYDALVLALGTQPRTGIAGAVTFRDQRDLPLIRHVVSELDAGELRRLVFAAPAGVSWPLPLYELALESAARTDAAGLDVDVSVVSPEHAPLEVLGAQASAVIAGLLADRGVRFVGGSAPAAVRREGRLDLHFAGSLPADRVIAVPELRGRRIRGVGASWSGFVPTDGAGRVEGLPGVYAAGDMTTCPIKHGGLAMQQADGVARAIAASFGADAGEPQAPHVLQVQLLGGDRPLSLRTTLDADGRPRATEVEEGVPAPPPYGKALGRLLTPYLERRATVAV